MFNFFNLFAFVVLKCFFSFHIYPTYISQKETMESCQLFDQNHRFTSVEISQIFKFLNSFWTHFRAYFAENEKMENF